MTSDTFSSVLLTYKGKMLLLSPDLDPKGNQLNLWGFIGGEKSGSESFEKSLKRKIKYTTKLELSNALVPFPSVSDPTRHFYHVELTDREVNSIERREGQRLEFYTFDEVEKLTLIETTSNFFSEEKAAIKDLLSH